jgi:uncharacterized membrane protein
MGSRTMIRMIWRSLLIAAPFASIIIWVPTLFVLWRTLKGRRFILAALCVPELIYGLVDGGGFIASKLFNIHGANNDIHRALAILTGILLIVMIIKALWDTFKHRTLLRFVFLGLVLLAVGISAHSWGIRSILYSGAAFSAAGLIGVTEALRARKQNRIDESDSALANSGLVFVLGALAPLALIGM